MDLGDDQSPYLCSSNLLVWQTVIFDENLVPPVIAVVLLIVFTTRHIAAVYAATVLCLSLSVTRMSCVETTGRVELVFEQRLPFCFGHVLHCVTKWFGVPHNKASYYGEHQTILYVFNPLEPSVIKWLQFEYSAP